MSGLNNFYKKRNEIQEAVSERFSNMRKDEIIFHEFPTGLGKTYIDILSAYKYRVKHDTPVIISTNTNKNVLEIFNTFKRISTEYEFDKDSVVVEIGKSNYIDIERLYNMTKEEPSLFPDLNPELLKQYFMTKEEPLTFSNNIFLYDFLDKIGYKHTRALAFSLFMQDDVKTISPKTLTHIEDHLLNKKIIITNHAYLIVLLRHYGNPKNKGIDLSTRELLFNTPIIMDEVHTLYDAARSIFTNRFSLFRLKYSIKALLTTEEKSLSQTLRKSLKMILSNIIESEKEIAQKTDTHEIQSILASFKAEIGGRVKLDRVASAIKASSMSSQDGDKYARFTSTELNELSIINLHKTVGTKIELSPKGFPTVEVMNKIPSYELRSMVWMKHHGPVMGLSGTLRTQSGDGLDSYRWILERLGFFLVNENDTVDILNDAKNIDDEVKDFILEQNRLLNKKIENIQIETHTSLFERSKYIYTVVEDPSLKIPVKASAKGEIYEKDKMEWRNNVGIFIANNLRYNSLVLVVGYEDARYIAEQITSQRDDIAVHYAKEGISMHDTVSRYINDINNGMTACLIGTEQYYIGLDLAGDFLQELYMGKIPFQNPSGKVGNKVYKHFTYSKLESYRNETMLKFLQGKGRPIRGYNDKAILYILDNRILDAHREQYRAFLGDSAIANDYVHTLKTRHKFFNNNGTGICSSIYTLFYDYFGNKPLANMIYSLKIPEYEMDKANSACEFILRHNLIKDKKYLTKIFTDALQSDKYSFWQTLFKIVIENHPRGREAKQYIMDYKLLEHGDINTISKQFFLEEEGGVLADFLR